MITNQTTGFCGVVFATLATFSLPPLFAVDLAKNVNVFGCQFIPQTCLVSESAPEARDFGSDL